MLAAAGALLYIDAQIPTPQLRVATLGGLYGMAITAFTAGWCLRKRSRMNRFRHYAQVVGPVTAEATYWLDPSYKQLSEEDETNLSRAVSFNRQALAATIDLERLRAGEVPRGAEELLADWDEAKRKIKGLEETLAERERLIEDQETTIEELEQQRDTMSVERFEAVVQAAQVSGEQNIAVIQEFGNQLVAAVASLRGGTQPAESVPVPAPTREKKEKRRGPPEDYDVIGTCDHDSCEFHKKKQPRRCVFVEFQRERGGPLVRGQYCADYECSRWALAQPNARRVAPKGDDAHLTEVQSQQEEPVTTTP
jgi:hypothetical protein